MSAAMRAAPSGCVDARHDRAGISNDLNTRDH
jgi:hypothetical protein